MITVTVTFDDIDEWGTTPCATCRHAHLPHEIPGVMGNKCLKGLPKGIFGNFKLHSCSLYEKE